MVAGDTLVIILADHECAGFSLIGALTGGISNLKNLADDHQTLDPNTQPGRQKVVGVYDAAGFPSYAILPDGYPQTFDIDGKLLVGSARMVTATKAGFRNRYRSLIVCCPLTSGTN